MILILRWTSWWLIEIFIQNLYVLQYLHCVEFCYKQKDAADPKMLVAQVNISTVQYNVCGIIIEYPEYGFFLGFAGESWIL